MNSEMELHGEEETARNGRLIIGRNNDEEINYIPSISTPRKGSSKGWKCTVGICLIAMFAMAIIIAALVRRLSNVDTQVNSGLSVQCQTGHTKSFNCSSCNPVKGSNCSQETNRNCTKCPQNLSSNCTECNKDGVVKSNCTECKQVICPNCVNCTASQGNSQNCSQCNQQQIFRNCTGGGQQLSNCSNGNTDQCTTPDCVILAGEMLTKMNISADPCKDFYVYACGEFGKPEHRPPTVEALGTLNQQKITTYMRLAHILTATGIEHSSAIRKAKLFYSACLNDTGDDEKGKTDLLRLVTQLKFWPFAKSSGLYFRPGWDASRWKLEDAMLAAHGMALDTIFSIKLQPHPANSSTYILNLDSPSLTLNERSVYLDDEYQTLFKAYVLQFLIKLYDESKLFTERSSIEKLWRFEKALALVSTFKSATINELTRTTKFLNFKRKLSFLNSESFFNKLYAASGRRITDDTDIVMNEQYFQSLDRIVTALGSNKNEVLAMFIVWRGIHSMSEFSGSSFRLQSEAGNWAQCVLATETMLNYAVGTLYQREYTNKEVIPKVDSLIQDIREEFLSGVRNLSWVSEPTREKIVEKARALSWEIGHPTAYEDSRKLDEYYRDFAITSDYFNNVMEYRKYQMRKLVQMYGQLVNRAEWKMASTESNAYYDITTNRIFVPQGILQKPLYSRNSPLSVFYGSVGFLVSHEFIHGFDSNGRKYDSNGNLVNWWSSSSETEYVRHSQCFIDEFNRQRIFDKAVNGSITLAENIADNGGIGLAYRAYQNAIRDGKTDERLPGLGLTRSQQFFLSYAQTWCWNVDEKVADKLLNGEHAPDPFRVNVVLRNRKEFAEAFNCPKSSGMSKKSPCTLW